MQLNTRLDIFVIDRVPFALLVISHFFLVFIYLVEYILHWKLSRRARELRNLQWTNVSLLK